MDAKHLRMAEQMDKTARRLLKLNIVPWQMPRLFLWCRLPAGIGVMTVARVCLKDGVVVVPGNAFSQSLSASDSLRFYVAQSTDERVFSVLSKALSV